MKIFHAALLVLFLALCRSTVSAGTVVEFQLISANQILGVVDVALYDHDKPVTVSNFLSLIRLGAYNSSFFHRTVPGFVLQGGGFVIYNATSTLPMTNTLTSPGPGNIGVVPSFGPIIGEANANTFYSNTNGTIAMALSTGPNSATSQFFFNLTNNNGTTPGNANLDNTSDGGPFTVFGHVINGMNLLTAIEYGFSVAKAAGTNAGPFTQMPVYFTVPLFTVGPPYDDLLYFNLYVLPNLSITSPASGSRATNALATVTGTASASPGLAGVWYELNGGQPQPVITTNTYTNWTANVPLLSGTNFISAIAEDLNGHYSPVSGITLISTNTFKLQLAATNSTPTSGAGFDFNLQISPGLNGHVQYSTNLINWTTLTNFIGTNPTLTIHDPAATNTPHRYYRAIIP